MKKVFTLILACFLCGISFGQIDYIEPGFNIGRYCPFGNPDFEKFHNYYQPSIDIRAGWQMLGKERWQQSYNYPSIGAIFAYNHNTLDSVRYEVRENGQIVTKYGGIGEFFTLGAFMNGPFYRWKHWSFDYDIIFGCDFFTKWGNEMIGSMMNFHMSLDLGPTIRLTDNLDLAARFLFQHSSNAATFLPDYGVNSHQVRLALRYHPNGNKIKDVEERDFGKFEKQNNLFVSVGPGWLQTYSRKENQLPYETPFFFATTLRAGFSRQFCQKLRWDVGLDGCWTGETKMRYELLNEKDKPSDPNDPNYKYNFWRSTHLAASADVEVCFGRFSFCVGGAYYLTHGIYAGTGQKRSWGADLNDWEKARMPEMYKPYYERVGFKFYIGKEYRFYAGAFMKMHLSSIDHIEWTFGANLF